MYIKCNSCGQSVSSEVPDNTVVRAWIECPECCGKNFDQTFDITKDPNSICECGHMYWRHFDTYDSNSPVGCKYCECTTFKERQ